MVRVVKCQCGQGPRHLRDGGETSHVRSRSQVRARHERETGDGTSPPAPAPVPRPPTKSHGETYSAHPKLSKIENHVGSDVASAATTAGQAPPSRCCRGPCSSAHGALFDRALAEERGVPQDGVARHEGRVCHHLRAMRMSSAGLARASIRSSSRYSCAQHNHQHALCASRQAGQPTCQMPPRGGARVSVALAGLGADCCAHMV
jgi:hypothetical protein